MGQGEKVWKATLLAQPQETILQLLQELIWAWVSDIDVFGTLFSHQQDLAERLARLQTHSTQGHGEPKLTKMTK